VHREPTPLEKFFAVAWDYFTDGASGMDGAELQEAIKDAGRC
jgi:hypothetical protein